MTDKINTLNILITSVSKKVLLVKSFRKTLSEISGGNIIATDINEDSVALYFADKHYITPKTEDDSYLQYIVNLCKKENIRLIIPTRCEELSFFSKEKGRFESLGCKVMVCDYKSLDICQDKNKFVKFCVDNDIPVPNTYYNNIDSYPVFIKPNYGKSGIGIRKINNEDELNMYVKNKEDYVIQENIKWDEYTIDYFADFNGNCLNMAIRKRIRVINGESCVSKIYNIEKIEINCRKLGNKLKLIGHNTIQCFYDDETNCVKFIEINPRFGGAGNLGVVAGLDSPRILINLLLDKDISCSKIKDNLIMLRYSEDKFFYKKDTYYSKDIIDHKDKIYCIDIDGTVCTETQGDYSSAEPMLSVITKINRLYKNGNIIKLFTARGAASGKDWYDFTEKQLKKWNIKYHELIMGKPYADYYIDNKGIDIFDWI
jgi:carbamoyl-phosphate synthase large subunit